MHKRRSKIRFHVDEDDGVYFVRDRGSPHPVHGLRLGGMIVSGHSTRADAQAEAARLNGPSKARARSRLHVSKCMVMCRGLDGRADDPV